MTISRRALFGLSVGAVAAAKATNSPAAQLKMGNAGAAYDAAVAVGMDIGKRKQGLRQMINAYYIPNAEFRNVEYVNLREIEFPNDE